MPNPPPDPTANTRRALVLLFWVFSLLFAAWLFNGMLERQDNPNRQVQTLVSTDGAPEVVLQRNRQGHYVADAYLNGQRTQVLLDTGATDVAIPGRLARRLDLPRLGNGYSETAAGTVPVWRTRLREVRLGSIRMRNVPATVVPAMDGNTALLGMSFLKHLRLQQQGDQMTLSIP